MSRGLALAYLAGVATPALIGALIVAVRVLLDRTVSAAYVCPACAGVAFGPDVPRCLPRAWHRSLRGAKRTHWQFWTAEAAGGSRSAIALAHWNGPTPEENL